MPHSQQPAAPPLSGTDASSIRSSEAVPVSASFPGTTILTYACTSSIENVPACGRAQHIRRLVAGGLHAHSRAGVCGCKACLAQVQVLAAQAWRRCCLCERALRSHAWIHAQVLGRLNNVRHNGVYNCCRTHIRDTEQGGGSGSIRAGGVATRGSSRQGSSRQAAIDGHTHREHTS